MDLHSFIFRIQNAQTVEDLGRIRTEIFGKTGQLTVALRGLGSLPEDKRKIEAASLNVCKSQLLAAIDTQSQVIEAQQWATTLQDQSIDVTVPTPLTGVGRGHPLHQVMQEIIEIFAMMGFSVRRGPDVETEFYNFDALNVPADHPARAMQDTFYMPKGHVLRTQTSPVQIRTLTSEPLPLRIISPGRVYRSDHDRTHTPMFHQAECLVVEPGVHMGHLKGCLSAFLDHFFGRSVKMRFRPSFFPFTSPSAEVDIACHRKGGQLHMGSGDSWLEILGCGMVNPKVFRSCGVTETVTGFAAGMGLERLAMLKYGIEDIRHLFLNDQRWLDEFGFSSL